MEQALNPIVAELKEHATASQTPKSSTMTSEELVADIKKRLPLSKTPALESLIHLELKVLIDRVELETRRRVAYELCPESFHCNCILQEVAHE